MIRYARMSGRKALWVPGTDHAGIATQVGSVAAGRGSSVLSDCTCPYTFSEIFRVILTLMVHVSPGSRLDNASLIRSHHAPCPAVRGREAAAEAGREPPGAGPTGLHRESVGVEGTVSRDATGDIGLHADVL